MSRHVHFDLVGGIAGDMCVAALVDAGASLSELRARLAESGLPRATIAAERVWRGGLAGTAFTVAPEAQPPSRHWRDIRALLQGARLPERARRRALDVFTRLAEAEAHVHGCSPDDAHFHEVGALDSIVDIVAAALALELLDADGFSCSAVPICQGSTRTEHGVLPLPAPATARLLLGFRLLPIEGAIETVTPTGAALLASLCPGGEGAPPPLRLLATGAGLGSAELPGRPNVLRVLVGEPAPAGGRPPRQDAVVIEAAIDDLDPRVYGRLAEQLFAAGALDVALGALQMKKGRPGTLVTVVARPELEGVLSGVLLRETTSLGVRSHDVRRTELARRHERVETPWGAVRLKVGRLGDEILNVSPEYDDCEGLARAARVPVKDVLAAALVAGAGLRDHGRRPTC